MTPLEIKIMLHYYCSPTDYEPASPAASEAVDRLINRELLTTTHGRSRALYEITERGLAYVEMLKKVPLPICKWGAL